MNWREREARNGARFRDQNEWIERAWESFGGHGATTTFVCECGDGDCHLAIELSTFEYEAVRSVSNRFAVAPDHENPESDVLVSECLRYSAVQAVEGLSLRIARETDPRIGTQPLRVAS
jgi:hypothetical protein